MKLSSIKGTPRMLGGLGSAMGLYGLGTSDPSVALGGLGVFASSVIAAHQTAVGSKRELAAIKQQPAYVLMTARRVHEAH